MSSGQPAEFLKQTRLKEPPEKSVSALETVKNLLLSHEAIIQSLRVDLETCGKKFHDADTNDFSPQDLWSDMKRWPGCCGRWWNEKALM